MCKAIEFADRGAMGWIFITARFSRRRFVGRSSRWERENLARDRIEGGEVFAPLIHLPLPRARGAHAKQEHCE